MKQSNTLFKIYIYLVKKTVPRIEAAMGTSVKMVQEADSKETNAKEASATNAKGMTGK